MAPFTKRLACVVLAFAFVAGSRAARAESQDHEEKQHEGRSEENGEDPRARALFVEARVLVRAGRYAEACPKFEESRRLVEGAGTDFNLADCWEHVGRRASAHGLFLRVASLTHDLGQSERESAARDRAKALEGTFARLLLRVTAATPDLEIHGPAGAFPADSWGKPVSVEPGTLTIEARAPGKKTWLTHVRIPEGSPTITIDVPRLHDAETVAATTPNSAPSVHLDPPRRSGTATWAMLGVAGAGALTAGISLGIYAHANSNAHGVCPGNERCTDAEIDRYESFVSQARTARAVGVVGLAVSGASLIGATIFFLRDSSASRSDKDVGQAWTGRAAFGAGSASLLVQRSF